jgi:rhomboid family GlyGly-CTERM serine protease
MSTQHESTTERIVVHDWPWATTVLTALAVLVYYMPGLGEAWVYERGTGLGEAWRYLGCHWVHWNGEHLFWSTATFLVLSAVCEDISRWRHGVCVLATALAIPAGLWLWSPELASYGGLSGIDSALFGLVAVSVIRESIATKKWVGAGAIGLLAVGFVIKISYEMLTGGTAFMTPTDAMVPVPLAHVIGVITGVLLGLAGGLNPKDSLHCARLNRAAEGDVPIGVVKEMYDGFRS